VELLPDGLFYPPFFSSSVDSFSIASGVAFESRAKATPYRKQQQQQHEADDEFGLRHRQEKTQEFLPTCNICLRKYPALLSRWFIFILLRAIFARLRPARSTHFRRFCWAFVYAMQTRESAATGNTILCCVQVARVDKIN
jgi:hypothetical protein